jgi:PAS domain S-box-containing protein
MRILHLEDNLSDAERARRQILAAWPEAEISLCGDTSKLGLLLLRSADFDAVVSETKVGGSDGFACLELVRKLSPETPFIFLTSTVDPEGAVRALCAGAADYVFKDRAEMFVPAINRVSVRREELLRARHMERQSAMQAQMLRQAMDIIIVEDQNGRINQWNLAAERALGWTQSEAVGKTLKSFADTGFAAALDEASRNAIEKGAWSGEFVLQSKNGQSVPLEIRRTLVRDHEGRPVAQLTVGRDLTERRRLEEQLFRSQRMECVSSMAAGTAHDLNNVLTPMIMALGLLKRELREPGQVRLMATLEKGAERGAALVRQLLSFMHGNSAPARVLNPADAIREIGAMVRATFPASIKLVEEAPEGLWPVKAQETHLHQMLLNLALNARDAMPDGGELGISARNAALSEDDARLISRGRAGKFVLFEVSDSGMGIRPEDRDRIWEPFFTTKPEGKGTGLGLPTVRGIIARYEGFAQMDSTLGGGTCFRLYLPAAIDGITPEGDLKGAASDPSKDETVLVIDQSREVRELTTAVLRRYGYRSLAVADGLEGAALFKKDRDRFSVVIADLRAQGLGGGRLGEALRRINPDVRLVFTGSGASDEEAADVRRLGAQLLLKPFQPDELLYAVMAAMKQSERAVVR